MQHTFRRFLLPFLVPLILMSFTGCGGSGDDGPEGPITVLAMGDSNTRGFHYPRVGPWTGHLRAMEPEWRVINSGVDAERAQGGRSRLPGQMNRHNPDVVVIMYGANNAINGNTGAFENDIRAMINEVRSRDSIPILVNIMPMTQGRIIFQGTVDRLNESLANIAREEKVGLVDLAREFRGDAATERFPDGLHPDEDGNRIIAMAIRERIRKAF
ncbi:MAG: SGNH/GDSL hydrolase family protein [Verrucomicrobia bacterium]|nr:SGNH/GDSL hydrolase family protein [Verrucomicrobiota bacterium]MCH8512100.1 SGNH/GDSL hydrolase family protein [Kiritimatiellia bacterium]